MDEKQFDKLDSIRVKALDDILGKPFPVLNDGFIRVIDYMGSDESIVQAARVSYGKGTKKVHQDRGLIRYLMRHRHTTPFEMCEIKLHMRVPMDCWRQWIRHRTASVNEYSTRYSLAIDAAQSTKPDEWRIQSESNRQGSEGYADAEMGNKLTNEETKLHSLSRDIYNRRIESGIAREQARKDLPLSTYTEAYWKIDLHNLFHFLSLRMDSHAQLEIRLYSEIIGKEIVKRWVPIAWDAFEDFRLGSNEFSKLELDIMSKINMNNNEDALLLADNAGWLEKREDGSLKQNLERIEFEEKLNRINSKIPWLL
ncbi:MAG: thymidylate synthase (FAD) [Ignavibacteriae bacterium HGW-Ignavibacteriae-2]|jgi:thymidylate synthase (FAD)|nr:FAD-dependent thymidylate synthase [Bacteroidota bacterium]PKL88196.1 MAG: thymidylate synthase (FAD) [Ignavibacteriae bacterium HGW-Ignavibacteriae-2]